MAIVPIALQGTLNLQSVNPGNFQIEIFYHRDFITGSGNDVTSPSGITALKNLLASIITGAAPNYPAGTVDTNEISFNAGTDILTIDIQGDGSNAAIYLPSAIAVNQGIQNANVVAFRFGSITCPEPIACQECYDAHISSCSDIDLALDFLPTTEYTVLIIDSWDDQIRLDKTSDANGVISITGEDIPSIDLMPGAAPFSVRAFLQSSNEPHQFIIGGSIYACINLHPTAGAPTTAPDPLIATATST